MTGLVKKEDPCVPLQTSVKTYSGPHSRTMNIDYPPLGPTVTVGCRVSCPGVVTVCTGLCSRHDSASWTTDSRGDTRQRQESGRGLEGWIIKSLLTQS